MSLIVRMLKKRRNVRKDILGSLGTTGVWISSAILFVFLSVSFLMGLGYIQIFNNLPDQTKIIEVYGAELDRFPPTTVVYDRSGEQPLFGLLHPASNGREWVHLGPAITEARAPDYVNALVASIDPEFWGRDGIEVGDLLGSILRPEDSFRKSIPERLAEIALLPAEDLGRHPISRRLRSTALAQSIQKAYSKRQILELYLNSAHFGALAQGIDAASLQYFGIHAGNLDLGQSAFLVALIDHPKLGTADGADLKTAQGLVLADMVHSGKISEATFRVALSAPLKVVIDENSGAAGIMNSFAHELESILGYGAINAPGLEVRSTIEGDLQAQLECTVAAYLGHAEEELPFVQTLGGCDNLPSSFPTDNSAESIVSDPEAIVLDPTRGEILGLYGDVYRSRNPGRILDPFVYLAAFSQGHAPGSMILDLPLEGETESISFDAEAHGPVRMRVAMLGGYPYAFERVVRRAGQQTIVEVLSQMGVDLPQAALRARFDPQLKSGTSLGETALAYGVIARSGVMNGRPSSASLDPILIRSVRGPSGAEIYGAGGDTQSILSPSLAYLLIDVMSDLSARVEVFGDGTPFGSDQPTGMMINPGQVGGQDFAAIGFTPTRVVGVWTGQEQVEERGGNGLVDPPGSLWNAVMQLATKNVTLSNWDTPDGISFVEVCDPSGQLPTADCPTVVNEVYISGSEPTQLDQFFRTLSINRETGKLATVYTPIALVEEQSFFIPPLEALPWAEANQFYRPPVEYDPVGINPVGYDPVGYDPVGINPVGYDPVGINPVAEIAASTELWIDSPAFFADVRGQVGIRGGMDLGSIERYRLEVGIGLFPDRWYLIGEFGDPVGRGLLGRWDTEEFEGLITLQLQGIDHEGRVVTAYRSVTVDNQLPTMREIRSAWHGSEREIVVDVSDNIGVARVDIFRDDRLVMSLAHAPYIFTLDLANEVEAELFVRAYDRAGNRTESEIPAVDEG